MIKQNSDNRQPFGHRFFGHLHGLFTENLTRLSSLRSGIGGFFDNRASRTAGRPYRQVAAAFEAVGSFSQIAGAAIGAVLVWSTFCHADKGFIFDKVEGSRVNMFEFNLNRLRRAASRAAADRTRVPGAAAITSPNQFNIT